MMTVVDQARILVSKSPEKCLRSRSPDQTDLFGINNAAVGLQPFQGKGKRAVVLGRHVVKNVNRFVVSILAE